MSLTQREVKELARILDARALNEQLKARVSIESMSVEELAQRATLMRKLVQAERNARLRQRRRLKVIVGDALSSGAMKIARAYDAASPTQQKCMEAVAAVALAMQVNS